MRALVSVDGTVLGDGNWLAGVVEAVIAVDPVGAAAVGDVGELLGDASGVGKGVVGNAEEGANVLGVAGTVTTVVAAGPADDSSNEVDGRSAGVVTDALTVCIAIVVGTLDEAIPDVVFALCGAVVAI